MTIKKNSWHYAWYTWVLSETNSHISTPNLCQYFWLVMVGAPVVWALQRVADFAAWFPSQFWWVISRLLIAALAGALLTLLAALGYALYVAPWAVLLALGMMIGGMGTAIALILLILFIADRMEGKRVEVPGTAKLVWNYAWAKKRRICPFLTFEHAN